MRISIAKAPRASTAPRALKALKPARNIQKTEVGYGGAASVIATPPSVEHSIGPCPQSALGFIWTAPPNFNCGIGAVESPDSIDFASLPPSQAPAVHRAFIGGINLPEAVQDAVEPKSKSVALIIAILALTLALSEIGVKNSQHRSTENNIQASDLFNFYQAKKIRSTLLESGVATMAVNRLVATDPKIAQAMDRQIDVWNATIAGFANDTRTPGDSMGAILDRAKAASKARELFNRRLAHYELASGLLQIAIVLASAAIITGFAALLWLSSGLGILGAVLTALGFLASATFPLIG